MTNGETRWRRARVLRALDAADALTLVQPDGTLVQLTGASADLGRVVLDACALQPSTHPELRVHVEQLAGEPLENPAIVEELLVVLARAGAVFSDAEKVLPLAPPKIPGWRVVLGLTGGVQSAHAPALAQMLMAQGHTVRVMASESALRFVSATALEALTHQRVVSSMWPAAGQPAVPHMELAEWAQAVLVWPMSASTTSRLAHGDCSALVAAVAISTRAPTLLAPSMNPAMLTAPSVARNLETLREDGFTLLPPAMAHEVAHAPRDRIPLLGGAPMPQDTALLLACFLSMQHRNTAAIPADAPSWEAFHATSAEESHAWYMDRADEEITAALDTVAPDKGWLWDVGCGPGTLACWAFDQGWQVVASDIAHTAVDRARQRGGSRGIVWLRDDVTRTSVRSVFDAVVDRGTLHVLPESQQAAWGHTMNARVKQGGILVVKTHLPPGPGTVRSHPMDTPTVAALLGPGWTLQQRVAGVFGGSISPAPPSVVSVFQRVAPG